MFEQKPVLEPPTLINVLSRKKVQFLCEVLCLTSKVSLAKSREAPEDRDSRVLLKPVAIGRYRIREEKRYLADLVLAIPPFRFPNPKPLWKPDYVLLPGRFTIGCVLRDLEEHMRHRTARLSPQAHSCFLGGSIALLDIALQASGGDVIPCIDAAAGARNDVVDRQIMPFYAAILASVVIAVKYIAPRQADLFIRDLDVVP